MTNGTDRDRAPVEHFERLARESEDPWDYATSEYEQAKYRTTLEYLPERTGRTLELGCSVGIFTAMLAPRTSHLVAVDFSPTALERAAERLAGAENVETSGDSHEVTTRPEDFMAVKDALEKKFGPCMDGAAIVWKPTTTTMLDQEQAQSLFDMIEALEDSDDVQKVFSNFEVEEGVMEKLLAS